MSLGRSRQNPRVCQFALPEQHAVSSLQTETWETHVGSFLTLRRISSRLLRTLFSNRRTKQRTVEREICRPIVANAALRLFAPLRNHSGPVLLALIPVFYQVCASAHISDAKWTIARMGKWVFAQAPATYNFTGLVDNGPINNARWRHSGDSM